LKSDVLSWSAGPLLKTDGQVIISDVMLVGKYLTVVTIWTHSKSIVTMLSHTKNSHGSLKHQRDIVEKGR
jgi:hypothetical protein